MNAGRQPSMAGCSSSDTEQAQKTLHVAALEGGYGRDMYTQVIAAYQAEHR